MFDPWTATALEAVQEQTRQAGVPVTLKAAAGWLTWHSPLCQWETAQDVKKRREAVEAGDGLAILSSMRDCAKCGMIAPEWLADAFVNRCNSVFDLKVKSWDKAFGKPFPKGRQLETAREEREKMFLIYAAVHSRHQAGERIDKALFESVGEMFDMGATRTEEIFYKAKRTIG
ncbi:MAG TPA: hypothetical protein PLP29_19630 [Candidatus Ozemobacteraceae bacterium]|nr:hypothetical protein [Candidatus Ozemobacteraceae bacterium]